MLLNATHFYVYYYYYFSVVPNVEGDFFKPSFISKLFEAHIVMAEVSQACSDRLCEKYIYIYSCVILQFMNFSIAHVHSPT